MYIPWTYEISWTSSVPDHNHTIVSVFSRALEFQGVSWYLAWLSVFYENNSPNRSMKGSKKWSNKSLIEKKQLFDSQWYPDSVYTQTMV